ncbi:hypothetical protein Dda_6078 [Drechslerella dactyloides]|uniref:RNA-directed DNA polymerase n=1 Tax=Drechslerella dactyloides TaxID=74499 RepID=A0AAD6NI73_DREDA|nr:hypothetical protein Dda_6078 [Drechslerella dactyloides]
MTHGHWARRSNKYMTTPSTTHKFSLAYEDETEFHSAELREHLTDDSDFESVSDSEDDECRRSVNDFYILGTEYTDSLREHQDRLVVDIGTQVSEKVSSATPEDNTEQRPEQSLETAQQETIAIYQRHIRTVSATVNDIEAIMSGNFEETMEYTETPASTQTSNVTTQGPSPLAASRFAPASGSGTQGTGNPATSEAISNKAPKIGDPIRYGGQPEKLDQFLNQLSNHFFFYPERFPTDWHKILFTGMYLEGNALNIYLSYKQTYDEIAEEDREAKIPEISKVFSNFQEFTNHLKRKCGYKNKTEEALRKLDQLKQTGSARSFFQQFDQYAPLTDYDDDALFYRAREGLKPNLRTEIIKQKLINKDMRYYDMQTMAIELDDALYHSQKNTHQKKPYHNPNKYNPNKYTKKPQQNWTKIGKSSWKPNKTYGPEPMDLNTTQHQKPKKSNTPLCYQCNKAGHIKRNCPENKGKKNFQKHPQQERKFGMMRRSSTPEDFETVANEIWRRIHPGAGPVQRQDIAQEINATIERNPVPFKDAEPEKDELNWLWSNPTPGSHLAYRRSSDGRLWEKYQNNEGISMRAIQTSLISITPPRQFNQLQQELIPGNPEICYGEYCAKQGWKSETINENTGKTISWAVFSQRCAQLCEQRSCTTCGLTIPIGEKTTHGMLETNVCQNCRQAEEIDTIGRRDAMEKRRSTYRPHQEVTHQYMIQEYGRPFADQWEAYWLWAENDENPPWYNPEDRRQLFNSIGYLLYTGQRCQLCRRDNADVQLYGHFDLCNDCHNEWAYQHRHFLHLDYIKERLPRETFGTFECTYCIGYFRTWSEYCGHVCNNTKQREWREILETQQTDEYTMAQIKELMRTCQSHKKTYEEPTNEDNDSEGTEYTTDSEPGELPYAPCAICALTFGTFEEWEQHSEDCFNQKYHDKAPETRTGYFCENCTLRNQREHTEAGNPSLHRKLTLTSLIFGKPTKTLIDSGAEESYISTAIVQKYQLETRQKSNTYRVTAFSHQTLGQVTQETTLKLFINGHLEEYPIDILDLPEDTPLVLGFPWLAKHNPSINWRKGEITFHDCNCQKVTKKQQNDRNTCKETHLRLTTHLSDKEIRNRHKHKPNTLRKAWIQVRSLHMAAETVKIPKWISKEARNVFQPAPEGQTLPEINSFKHSIPLQEGTQPRFMPIYGCTDQEAAALREYIEENLKTGYIRPSNSPAGHPILFVKKKDSEKLRICIDYRTLNAITIKDRGPLPLISESFDRISGAIIYTKLDLTNAYYNIRINPGEEWKTAFRTRYGLFEYLVMPFGLTNAPATFQTFMNHVLRKYIDNTCVVYLDDILIYSKDPSEHRIHVNQILETLNQHKLKVKPEKSEFEVTEVEFLGAIITPHGIKMDPKKVQAIQDWPTPKTLKEVQAFLGLCNYYRRFVQEYSYLAIALSELTKKDIHFEMTKKRTKAFQTLKEAFISAPILKLYDPELPVRIEADASIAALGACLLQKQPDQKWHPVAYLSHKFDATETRYPIHDKELMAILHACKKWRVYLQTKEPFEVLSDHKNLTYFLTTKELSRRQVRWWETLSEYNMKITHFKGKENVGADAISRRPDLMKDIPTDKGAILEQQGNIITINKELNITIHEIEPEIATRLKESYQKDATAKRILQNPEEMTTPFSMENGYILFKDLFYVPDKKIQLEILQLHHDTPMHGHLGIEKTQELITRQYFWPKMRQQIENYVKTCDLCLRNKPARHAPYGYLQPNEAPTKPFQIITYDFAQGLPHSRDPLTNQIYDEILIITCRLTKTIILEPWNSSWGAEQLSTIYNKRVFSQYGLQEKHICDRDPLFSSKYWKYIMSSSGTKLNIATKGRAQTDGASERAIQTVEIYLRSFLNYAQNNWTKLLPMAELTYNSSKHSVTNYTPYEALRGWNPRTTQPALLTKEEIPSAKEHSESMNKLHEHLKNDLDFAAETMSHYYNKKRTKAPFLKEGDKAYLLAKNIKTKRPNQKLDFQKLGPYTITKKLNEHLFELHIPGNSRIHKTFHIALLEPIPDGLREEVNNPEIEEDDYNEYEVEKILDHRKNPETLANEFLIKWKDYPPEEDSWQPEDNISPELVRQYLDGPDARQAGQDLPPRRPRGRPRKKQLTPLQGMNQLVHDLAHTTTTTSNLVRSISIRPSLKTKTRRSQLKSQRPLTIGTIKTHYRHTKGR